MRCSAPESSCCFLETAHPCAIAKVGLVRCDAPVTLDLAPVAMTPEVYVVQRPAKLLFMQLQQSLRKNSRTGGIPSSQLQTETL